MLRRVLAVLVGALVAVTGVGLVAAPAAAETCGHWVTVGTTVKYVTYDCETGPGGGGENGGGGGGGGSEPSCYLGRQDSFSYEVAFCRGELSCYRFVPPPSAPDPADWPERPAGTPETATYAHEACFTQPPEEALASQRYLWIESDEPPVEVLVTATYGSLAAPAFDVGVNPPRQAVVRVPTWYWADGAGGTVVGTNAGGLVAFADPSHLEVDPGDGSGTFTCAFSTAQSDACTYTYRRASVDGSATSPLGPAHTARVRLVYDVRFEMDGSPFTMAGIPTEFSSGWESATVPVVEVQSIIGRGR